MDSSELCIKNTDSNVLEQVHQLIDIDGVADLKYQADHNYKLTCEVFGLLGELLSKTKTLKTLRVECSSYPSAKDKILEGLCVNDTVTEFCIAFARSHEHIRPFDQHSLFEMIKWNTNLTKLKIMNVFVDIDLLGKSLESNTTLKSLVMKGVKGNMSLLGNYAVELEELEIHNTGFLYGDHTDCMCGGSCGIEEVCIDLSKLTFPKKLLLDNVQPKGKLNIPSNLISLHIRKIEAYDLDELFEILKTNTTLKELCISKTYDEYIWKDPDYMDCMYERRSKLRMYNTTLERLCIERKSDFYMKGFKKCLLDVGHDHFLPRMDERLP
jgi:hypothetical protein